MIRSVSRTWLVVDIVGSVFGALITIPLSLAFISGGLSTWMQPEWLVLSIHVIIGVVMWGAAAISRLSPALALIIAWVAAIAQMACGFPPLPFNVAIFGVLFATSAWGSRRMLWFGGGSTVVGGIVAGLYMALLQFDTTGITAPAPPALRTLLIALMMGLTVGFALVIAWGAGLLWRVVRHGQQTREAQLRAETMAAEEQERARIARDMHDVVAHSLAVVIAQADGARYAASSHPELAQEALGTIATTARSALSDVRMLLTQLRHRQGDGPQPTLADLETLFAQVRQAGIEPRVTVDPMPPGEPPGAIQLAVYRILQEALTNALRHGAGDVDVNLAWLDNRVDIVVRNTVVGSTATLGGGHGVVGMRERAQLVGGTLVAEREHGSFVVMATLPIGAQSPASTR
ncbi:sensor histidine kinase [Microbacterium sp. H1-D42]|uniref:sensor histidine kinase n=1 Tax=Microbacterium sp. H1-D42 TaxID=2925844 RepID=UPI001F52E5CD|nr:sensor histidine kinase [Microbacterium sp. H1-D42]UNK70195.1 sensor histidine kinase [Microbacterium sp. H1-D42]